MSKSAASGGGQQSPHCPNPREHRLPNGNLAVSSHWVHGVRDATTVASEDEQLYRLLMDILADWRVPDTMPARLAAGCNHLIDVRDTITDIHRGSANAGGRSYGLTYCYRVRDAIDEYRDREPLSLAAVGCSGDKINPDGPVPAKDLYDSGYWTCKQRYGETIPDNGQYKIISAEHAVLDPETPISYYERTPTDLEGVPVDSDQRLPSGKSVTTLLDQWALDVYQQLMQWLSTVAGGVDPRDVNLEILLGRKYRDRLERRGVFDALQIPGSLSISFPFQEAEMAQGGQGFQMQWMNHEVESAAGSLD
jgi:hypothetical protein